MYRSLHLRMQYYDDMPEDMYTAIVKQAIKCAKKMSPLNTPIYLAADDVKAIQMLKDTSVITNPLASGKSPPHLDKSTTTSPRDFDNLWVDLYMLAGSECVSHGPGGFGRLAVLLSKNTSCFHRYFYQARIQEC